MCYALKAIRDNIFRNRVNRELNKSKKDYYSTYFEDNKTNCKKVWEGIRSVINIKNSKNNTINQLIVDDKLIDETKPLSEQLGIETVDVEADKDTVRPWAATHIEKIGNEVNELKLQIDGFEFGQEFIGRKVDVSAAKQLNKFLGRPTTNDKIKYKI